MLRVPTAPSTDPRRAAGLIGFDIRALHRARLSRDPRFDGRFYIAVTTTGIYCRPICPSPTSRREHVVYYATAAAAAAAGFRPCRRCRPEAAPGSPAWLGTSAVVRRALRLIGEGALDHGSVEQLSELVGIGARHLHRLFVQHVGASPIAVAQTRRLHFAKRLLDDSALPITEIALASGFGSVRRFNSAFRLTFDCAPRDAAANRDPRDQGPRWTRWYYAWHTALRTIGDTHFTSWRRGRFRVSRPLQRRATLGPSSRQVGRRSCGCGPWSPHTRFTSPCMELVCPIFSGCHRRRAACSIWRPTRRRSSTHSSRTRCWLRS